jgi:hypothetical protein
MASSRPEVDLRSSPHCRDQKIHFRSIHAFHVMYNLEIQGLNPGFGAQIALLIQVIKTILIS